MDVVRTVGISPVNARAMSGSLAIATTELHVDHRSHSPVALTETEVLTLVATEILTRAGLRNSDALATI